MRAVNVLMGGVAASVLFATAASPADISPVVVPPPLVVVPPAPTTLSAYVEAFAGVKLFFDNDEVETLALSGPPSYGFGGAAHFAWQPRPTFSIQVDAWLERWVNQLEIEQDITWGVAGHASVHAGNFQFGPLVSVGHGYFGGTYVNLGGEAAVNGDRFRVYTQGGYIIAIAGSPVEYGSRDVYTQTVLNYYVRPNIALSVNAGADFYREIYYNSPYGEYFSIGLNTGARVEFQPEGRRFSVFAAYQLQWRNEFNQGDIDTTHVFGLGITAMLGQPDIQSRDRAVGLADFNPMFGPTFPH